MNNPHGGQSWPDDPSRQGQQHPPYGQRPGGASGQASGPPQENDQTAVMPAYPPPADAGATAVLPSYGGTPPRPPGANYPGSGYPGYGGPPPPEEPKSRTGLIVGLAAGAIVLLLIVVGVLAAVFVNQGDNPQTVASGTPTASATASASPTPEATDTPEASEAPVERGTHKALDDACGPIAAPLKANGWQVTTTFASSKSDEQAGTRTFCSVGINDSDTVVANASVYDKQYLGRSPSQNARTFYDIGRKQDGSAAAGATVRDVSGVGDRAYVQLPTDSRPIKVVALDDNLVIEVKVDSSERYSQEDAIKMASDVARAYIDAT